MLLSLQCHITIQRAGLVARYTIIPMVCLYTRILYKLVLDSCRLLGLRIRIFARHLDVCSRPLNTQLIIKIALRHSRFTCMETSRRSDLMPRTGNLGREYQKGCTHSFPASVSCMLVEMAIRQEQISRPSTKDKSYFLDLSCNSSPSILKFKILS